tara:strand:+ start:316 stop:1575 length:1260 start_codon:yes stop_codon:yes gene_type:complete
MILGYARVSTDKRDQDTSVKAQLEQLKAAGCVKIVKERRSAFKDARRPGWETCKAMIAEGLVSKFIVVSLSRATRRQETAEMSALCNEIGVEFVALTGGNVDVSTPEGLLNVGIQDTINAFDSKLKSVRIKQGLTARRKAGATAAGNCPFGWKYDGNKPAPDPKQWKRAKELWAELEANEFRPNPVLKTGKYPFKLTGLCNWMRNPILYGVLAYSDVTCEPLVTHEQWLRCQRLLNSRRMSCGRSPKRIHLFTQLVICCGCNRFLHVKADKHCGWRLKCMHASCTYYGKGIACPKVREQVIAHLVASIDEMAEQLEAVKPRDRILTPEQISAQRTLDQCLALQEQGIAIDQKSISELRAQLAVTVDLPGPDWGYWRNFIRQHSLLERMADDELRTVLTELLEQILYVGSPREVEITLRN